MAGLLYKEFIMNRKNLAVIGMAVLAVTSILFMAASDEMEALSTLVGMLVYFLIFVLTGEMFQSSIFEPDESKKWAYYVTSTPMLAKGQVLSKYYFTLIVSVITMIWCYFCDEISMILCENSESMLNYIILLFYFQLLLRAIEMPFLIRFGSKIGGAYKTVMFMVVIFAVIVYLLFGDLSKFGSMEQFFDWFINSTNGNGSGVILAVSAFMPYISLILYYLSYRLSVGFYLKGAENYDK